MRYRGMAAISLEQYAACLGSVLARVVNVVGSPLPCGAERLRESVPDATQARFIELVSFSSVAAPVAAAALMSPLASVLATLPASQRQPHVESLVLRAVRELTGDAEASVTAGTPLMEAGIDSLAATELSSRLRAATVLALSPTLVLEQPTPRAVAAHLLEQVDSPTCHSYTSDAADDLRCVDLGGRSIIKKKKKKISYGCNVPPCTPNDP